MSSEAPRVIEAPIDTAELIARARFSFDEPRRVSAEDAQKWEKFVAVTRNQIRSRDMQISRSLMPAIAEMIERVSARLMLSAPPIVFVGQSARPNAMAIVGGDEPLVVLTSGLIELLDTDEIAAVVGHEFGHALLRHTPIVVEGRYEDEFRLERSRAAEVSADRVGLIAADSYEAAMRAEVKMACGLSSRHLTFNINALIRDAEAVMRAAEQHEGIETSTHPDYPFRIWALSKFAASDLFASVSGGSGGFPFNELEREIEHHFESLGEGLAFRSRSDLIHQSLAWIGVLIVAEDADITASERDVLVSLVGTIWADDAAMYARRHGLEAVRRRVVESLEPLIHADTRARRRLESSVKEFGRRTGATARSHEMLKLISDAMEA